MTGKPPAKKEGLEKIKLNGEIKLDLTARLSLIATQAQATKPGASARARSLSLYSRSRSHSQAH